MLNAVVLFSTRCLDAVLGKLPADLAGGPRPLSDSDTVLDADEGGEDDDLD